MLTLSSFRAYVKECETLFTEISKSSVVMDDSQINKFLDDVKHTDKHILVGIIPKHNPFGDDDAFQSKDTMSFLVLKKIDRSDIKHEVYLDVIQIAQDITRALIIKMKNDKITAGDDCNIMGMLDISSIDINPIWGLASCDGYEIDFSLNTNL